MSVTVLKTLQNAQMNYETATRFANCNPIIMIAREQLSNAITALENGMSPNDVLQDGIGEDIKTKP